jgi:uncharacterized NAD-dependent epimerase/dehydratase family protein
MVVYTDKFCISSKHRVAILLHEGTCSIRGKTGLAFLRYGEAPVVAVIDQQFAGKSLSELTGIPSDAPLVASVQDALLYAPDVLLIGIAPSGGVLPEEWLREVRLGVQSGLSVVNGLHTPIAPELRELLKAGQWIWDLRQEPVGLEIGSAASGKLPCKRVLTVGTDMGVGKMSTSLEMDRAAKQRGMRSKFLATGQTGIMIAGDGVPLDAVRVDFASGAVEQMVMSFGVDRDILFVEGQGSLLHPGSTATLPLIRGSQPTHLVLVHRAGQTHIRDLPHIPIPPLPAVIRLYETVATAGGAFAPVRVVAIALNTTHLDTPSAQQVIEQTQAETGLYCTDPVRFGAEHLLDAVLADKANQELNS